MSMFEPRSAESLNFKEIGYEKKDLVARVTIKRPAFYNAYSTPALRELAAAFTDASEDDSVAVIVYTGEGHNAFCTGGDVKEYEREYTSRPRDYWKYMGLFKAYIESIVNNGKPTIARVNGMAVGGGNESLLACDMAVMADHTFLGQVGSGVGSVACGGATQWLPIVVGDKRAREILFLNERIPARKALDWGMVNRVAPSVTKDGAFIEAATKEQISLAMKGAEGYAIDLSRLDQEVDALCEKIIDKFAECTRYTKQQVNFWKDLAWHNTVGHARDWLSIHYCAWEPAEGMGAFVEKRKADYRGLRQRAAEGKSSEFPWGAPKGSCAQCGAKFLPEDLVYCGVCGAKL
jgi:enoyl-CoA hydratase/carnithine racemase